MQAKIHGISNINIKIKSIQYEATHQDASYVIFIDDLEHYSQCHIRV